MPSVEYTKKRSIASGSLGETETIDFDCQQIEPEDSPKTEELSTMGLAVSSVVESILQRWSVQTVPVTYSVANIAIWREFLHSCAGREFFQWDPTGTIAVPGANIYTVTLTPRWRFSRSGLGPNLMTVSMEFEETSA